MGTHKRQVQTACSPRVGTIVSIPTVTRWHAVQPKETKFVVLNLTPDHVSQIYLDGLKELLVAHIAALNPVQAKPEYDLDMLHHTGWHYVLHP